MLLGVGGVATKFALDSKHTTSAAGVVSASASASAPVDLPPSTPSVGATAPTIDAATIAVSSLPTASAPPAKGAGLGAWKPQPGSAAPSAAPSAPPSPPKPTAKPDCNPNYYLDSNGEKHFKPQCFQ